jgi:signal transduction histidine kinase
MDDARGRRGGPSIVARLAMALAGLALLLAALGWVGLSGLAALQRETDAARAAFLRLEHARAVETAFTRYLLREIDRRLIADPDAGESPEAAEVRGALLTYRRAVEADFAAASAQAAPGAPERAALLRAVVLRQTFDAIETEARLDRAQPRAPSHATARFFVERIASDRDRAFRAVAAETMTAERAAAGSALARVEAERARLMRRTGALGAVLLAAAGAFAVLFYRGLLRPIRALAAAADALGDDRAARAPTRLPGEFAALAARFNAMAGRIATEQGRLETEVAARTADLAAANAGLAAVDASRRRFFAQVSHELRTPVTALLGEAQVALRAPPGDAAAARAALSRIAASGGYLRRRLDDLMRLARSEDGALTLACAPADLNAAVAAAVETARAYAAAGGVSLAFAPAPGPAMALGDAEALRQAALALIDNAVKLSPEGGAVAVTVLADAAGAGFAVADRGPGFEGADPDALFGRWAQAAAGRRAGGAGLGLSIVRWIAEQHGGRAVACEREGGGAVVTVRLPPPPEPRTSAA